MRERQIKVKLHTSTRGLAEAMFLAKVSVWGGPQVAFADLSLSEQMVWTVRAAEFLRTVQPVPPEGRDDALWILARREALEGPRGSAA